MQISMYASSVWSNAKMKTNHLIRQGSACISSRRVSLISIKRTCWNYFLSDKQGKGGQESTWINEEIKVLSTYLRHSVILLALHPNFMYGIETVISFYISLVTFLSVFWKISWRDLTWLTDVRFIETLF